VGNNNVDIPRPTEETDAEWLGTLVNIGDQVTFRVEVCDFTTSPPFIQGKLLSLRSLSSEDAFMTSQKSPAMNKVESDLCIIDEHCKAKKEKKEET
jgi:hypothetical protein